MMREISPRTASAASWQVTLFEVCRRAPSHSVDLRGRYLATATNIERAVERCVLLIYRIVRIHQIIL
jgi:hypothetical protein